METDVIPRLGSLLTLTNARGGRAKVRFKSIAGNNWLCGLKKSDRGLCAARDVINLQCVVNEQLCTYRGMVNTVDANTLMLTLGAVQLMTKRKLRRDERIDCDLRSTVTWSGTGENGQELYQRRYCRLRNLSKTGAYLHSAMPMPRDKKELVLYTELPLAGAPDHMVILRGDVVRTSKEKLGDAEMYAYGIEFSNLLDWCAQDLQNFINDVQSSEVEFSA